MGSTAGEIGLVRAVTIGNAIHNEHRAETLGMVAGDHFRTNFWMLRLPRSSPIHDSEDSAT